MKLSQLAAKPQLIKITINDEDIVEKYGEELDFYVYDRHDLDAFMNLATINDNDQGEIVRVIKDMVHDEDGKKILGDGETLPLDIMGKVIEKVVAQLGNLTGQIIQK